MLYFIIVKNVNSFFILLILVNKNDLKNNVKQ